MILNEARYILGLSPDQDLHLQLESLRSARERLAEMTRCAPNETLALRYQEQLIDFDKALAALREALEAPVPDPVIPPPAIPPEVVPAVRPIAVIDDRPRATAAIPAKRARAWCWRTGLICAWIFVALVGVGIGYRLHLDYKDQRSRELQVRLNLLEKEGDMYVKNRRWEEAARAYVIMDFTQPGSLVAQRGLQSIKAGMAEEQTQFIGYWNGQALAELEANRLDEAQAAANQVIEKFPENTQALDILEQVASARINLARESAIIAIRGQLENQEWEEVITSTRELLAQDPDNPQAISMLTEATAALEKQASDQAKARELLAKAAARDLGGFDPLAIELLREATALDPSNKEIAALLEKIASYTQTLRVPGDYATPQEALSHARDKDRVVLAEGTWKGPLIIDCAVELQGANPETTLIECPAADGCAITIGPGGKGARISGITFRHENFQVDGSERFAAALVRGGDATFVNCRFKDASGHGLAVIDQGKASASRCRFTDNAWNGAAVMGAGSLMEIRDSLSLNNFEHGIESWNGAATILANNRCEGNSRNGIHADNGKASATIEGNQLIANREYGIVLSSAGSGRVTGNTTQANLLGGLVVRHAAKALVVNGNQATSNRGPGLALEAGLSSRDYEQNKLTGNKAPQMLDGVKFSQTEEQAKDDEIIATEPARPK